ncbi:MAG TPA: GerMN domain-containing protein [Smithellaceae bacterium]|nr:GerMN domain-containing protein [Smithellaceae bacterium]HRS82388.1 GerMN domain-containing protein [Smithellaceae bacterium]HRV44977.1 GerMN domain-containing protein [Smithellaceae bacterium]
MSTKKQRRSENFKDRQKKKSTRIAYLAAILGGGVLLLVIFFVILFNALFPPVDMEALNRKKISVRIYFADPQERFLVPEKRVIYREEDPALQAKEVVLALLEGSKTRSKTGNVNTFPAGVVLKDVRLDKDGTAQVNFNSGLTKHHPGGSTAEMMTVYSLTNTLAENVPQIRAVRILVDGKEISSIKGHISTAGPFRPDSDLFAPAKEEKS